MIATIVGSLIFVLTTLFVTISLIRMAMGLDNTNKENVVFTLIFYLIGTFSIFFAVLASISTKSQQTQQTQVEQK